MEKFKLTTPVALFFFNRPDTTMKVFHEIRKARPERLYLIGEGHRPDRIGELETVLNLRSLVEKSVDWDCQVFKNYVPEDIGAGLRISSGISWVFETEESAIFLEDDIIPADSFFQYCQEMLNHYWNDTRIMAVCGSNPIPEYMFQGDYTFSANPQIWGWATWKRAWNEYDFKISKWPEMKKQGVLRPLFNNRIFYRFRSDEYDRAAKGITFTWDYQFSFHFLINSGLAIIPKKNLTSNIGIGPNATNTKSDKESTFGIIEEMTFPIQFKSHVFHDVDFDEQYFRNVIFKPYYTNLWFRIKYTLKGLLSAKTIDRIQKIKRKK